MSREFTLRQSASIVPYLAGLGITHVHSSPLLKARAGSMHGYDVVDHHRLNEEIGSMTDLGALADELHRNRMGLILDVVPNHMAASQENLRWTDLLEFGPYSDSSCFFDVQWSPGRPQLENRVLLPILSKELRDALRAGEVRIDFSPQLGRLLVRAGGSGVLPLSPSAYSLVLRSCIPILSRNGRVADGTLRRLRHAADEFGKLPGPGDTLLEEGADVRSRARMLQGELASICRDEGIADSISASLRRVNSDYKELGSILQRQFYVISYWRHAASEINYRRFLSVNDLVAIRQDKPSVFEDSHRLLFNLVASGIVDGLRVDHADGLADPAEYFDWLRSGLRSAFSERHGHRRWRPYVVVEKVLSRGEALSDGWEVDGTTGYDFMNLVNGLFVSPRSSDELTEALASFTGRKDSFPEVAYRSKKLATRSYMKAEVDALAKKLQEIADDDVPLSALRRALEEVSACFTIYRTYVSPSSRKLTRTQSDMVGAAIDSAERRNPAIAPGCWSLLRRLLLRPPQDPRTLEFVMRFQQFTPVVMVEGVEDTAFYRYNRLVSLEDVGGEPDGIGLSLHRFHRANIDRMERWPRSMLTTSTHDAKRSEDVRARINVISEIAGEWRAHVELWSRMNRSLKRNVGGAPAPSDDDEYLLYQSLLGVWTEGPARGLADRMVAYMLKATRESKRRTSWLDPDRSYEEATEAFVRGILSNARFLKDFLPLQRKVGYFGMLNSLSQLLLKLTCPGVPEIYQGNEIWDYSLVDPDNRRRVDYRGRERILRRIENLCRDEGPVDVSSLLREMEDGAVKMFLLRETLRFRSGHALLFERGKYQPLTCRGPRRDNVCAFIRGRGDERVIVAVPRFFVELGGGAEFPFDGSVWGGTAIVVPHGPARLFNIYSRRDVPFTSAPGGAGIQLDAARVFSDFPVALLTSR